MMRTEDVPQSFTSCISWRCQEPRSDVQMSL